MTPRTHTWRFFRAGGSNQVALETADDLRHLSQLDRKLWVALACPVTGLHIDAHTLALMDHDGDGRIRAPEVLAAVEWVCRVLKDPVVIFRGGDLALASIDETTAEGGRVLDAARETLRSLGKSGASHLSVADTADRTRIFAQTRFNGDGVVPVVVVPEGPLRALAEAIVACEGASSDRSGRLGYSQAALDAFYADCSAFAEWCAQAEERRDVVLPLGDGTEAAGIALETVRAKIDDYFSRCRLAAFDARSTAVLNRQESDFAMLAAQDLSPSMHEVEGFPLACVDADRPLPLGDAVNPAWTVRIAAFQRLVVTPILGERTHLTPVEWEAIRARFAAYDAWQGAKAGHRVESLGLARVREILSEDGRRALQAFLDEDRAMAPAMRALEDVERLVRYQRDLAALLNNFVSFRDFYGRTTPAVFQAGTLFLDGRSVDLCVRVEDAGRHAALAGLAKCYLAYCECTRANGERMTIAAAFTGGDSDNLMVGRNGLFVDRDGHDWDATITKIIENPISIRQAFWAPYKKLVRAIEEQVAKRAGAGQAAAGARLDATASAATHLDEEPHGRAGPKKIDVGTVAALGVAVGAIGTFATALIGYLMGVLTLPFWQVVLAFAGLLLLVSTPSMLIAWLKLRQRNLGPILDANGWAVNGRVQMNVPFGGALTDEATVPPGAGSSFVVRYPEPPTILPKVITAIVLLAFVVSLLAHVGVLERFSGGSLPSLRSAPRDALDLDPGPKG
jgi:hypothetical protein